MKKYQTTSWSEGIRTLEVERETAKSVWIKNDRYGQRRALKASAGEYIFDTWKDAHDYLVKRAVRTVVALEERALKAKVLLSDIRAMTEPNKG